MAGWSRRWCWHQRLHWSFPGAVGLWETRMSSLGLFWCEPEVSEDERMEGQRAPAAESFQLADPQRFELNRYELPPQTRVRKDAFLVSPQYVGLELRDRWVPLSLMHGDANNKGDVLKAAVKTQPCSPRHVYVCVTFSFSAFCVEQEQNRVNVVAWRLKPSTGGKQGLLNLLIQPVPTIYSRKSTRIVINLIQSGFYL